MSELKIFEKAEFGSVRVILQDGTPWFVASDVAKALGYEKPANAVNTHCKKINKITLSPDLGGRHATISTPPIQVSIIPETDVYRLIMRSNLPEAEKFQDWVVEEVLPSIRKTGGYGMPKIPEDYISALRALADSEEAKLAAQKQVVALEEKTEKLEGTVTEMKPKAIFADSVATSKSSILIGQLATILRQNHVDIGQNRLFDWLRDNNYLVASGSRRNCPTQRSMDLGLFEVKERTVDNPDGSIRVTLTTKVTGKGQIYFVNKFLEQKSPPKRQLGIGFLRDNQIERR